MGQTNAAQYLVVSVYSALLMFPISVIIPLLFLKAGTFESTSILERKQREQEYRQKREASAAAANLPKGPTSQVAPGVELELPAIMRNMVNGCTGVLKRQRKQRRRRGQLVEHVARGQANGSQFAQKDAKGCPRQFAALVSEAERI